MSSFTLEEKTSFATQRARETEAEKHFYDEAQPHFPFGFSVIHRNRGHWDVIAQQSPGKVHAWEATNPQGQTTAKDAGRERAFRIRGSDGEVTVLDERWDPHRPHPRDSLHFRSVMGAMLWISEELMQEPNPNPPTLATQPSI